MKVVVLSQQPLGRHAKRYGEQESNPGTVLNLDWLPFLCIICRIASVNAVGKQFVITPSNALSLQRIIFYRVLATYQSIRRRSRGHLDRQRETEFVRRHTGGRPVVRAAGHVGEAPYDSVRSLTTDPETIGPEDFDR